MKKWKRQFGLADGEQIPLWIFPREKIFMKQENGSSEQSGSYRYSSYLSGIGKSKGVPEDLTWEVFKIL
jgi:hypothetical protein